MSKDVRPSVDMSVCLSHAGILSKIKKADITFAAHCHNVNVLLFHLAHQLEELIKFWW